MARAESSRWHAIYVRARFERVVALRLQDKVEESYLPLRRVVGPHHNSIHVPLFPGYVFCKCPSSVLPSLFMVPGVLSAIVGESIGGIPEQEIINLRRIVTAGVHSEIDQTCTKFADAGNLIVWEALPITGN